MKYCVEMVLATMVAVLPARADDWAGSKVEYRGALKDIVHDGNVAGVIDLDSLADARGLYALGAVEGLRGEITILDGKPYISSVADSMVRVETDFRGRATLLVFAQVFDWHEYAVPESVSTVASLVNFIAATAGRVGIDADLPFPFLIEGRPGVVEWHVVDWPTGDTVHTHEKHKASGLSGQLTDEAVTILGFYSSSHHGVFTHQSTNVHMHMVTGDGRLAGHVDSLGQFGPLVIQVPAR